MSLSAPATVLIARLGIDRSLSPHAALAVLSANGLYFKLSTDIINKSWSYFDVNYTLIYSFYIVVILFFDLFKFFIFIYFVVLTGDPFSKRMFPLHLLPAYEEI